MKKFVIKFLTFSIIILALFFLLLALAPINESYYMFALKSKYNRLDTLSNPRIIFIGGSNIAFGIDSKEIEDSLNINIHNTGLHAGIGLRFMLDGFKKKFKEGDILIIIPEYQHFYGSYNGEGDILTDALIYTSYKNLIYLNYEQLIEFISGFPKHLIHRFTPVNGVSWTYSAKNFNKWGDEYKHRFFDQSQPLNVKYKIDKSFDCSAADDLKNKIKLIEKEGTKVFLFWPVSIEKNYILNIDEVNEIKKEMANRGIYFAVSPDYFIVPDSLSFDGSYHINGEGVQIITSRLISILKELNIKDLQ